MLTLYFFSIITEKCLLKKIIIFLLILFPNIAFSKSPIHISFHQELTPLNPLFVSSSMSSNLIPAIFARLIDIDEKGDIRANLASNWKYNSKELKWYFKIHPKAFFHDGKKILTKHIKKTIQLIKNNKSPVFIKFTNNIKRIKILNEQEIEIYLLQNDNSFKYLISEIPIIPNYLFSEKGIPLNPKEYYKKPIGSGPYTVEYYRNDGAKLIFYDKYFKKTKNQQPLDVTITYEKDERRILSNLISKKTDISFFYDLRYLNTIQNIPHIIYKPMGVQQFSIIFNQNKKIFNNKNFKRSLNQAIDKNFIIQKLIHNHFYEISSGTVSPKYFSPKFYTHLTPYAFNPNVLKKFLKKEDIQLPLEFNLKILENDLLSEKIAKLVQYFLYKHQIYINIKKVSLLDLGSKVFKNKTYDLLLIPYNDGIPFAVNDLIWSSKSKYNFSSYKNIKAESFLEKALYAPNENESIRFYKNFQKEIYKNPPMIFILWRKYPVVYNRKLTNITFHPTLFFRNLYLIQNRENN